jgi:mono/diheme cytochrome c family protein
MACSRRCRPGTASGGKGRALSIASSVLFSSAAWLLASSLLGCALQRQGVPSVTAAASAAGTPEASPPLSGAQLFRERGCGQCHRIQGVGGHKGPDLSGVGLRLKPVRLRSQIVAGGGAMPAFGDVLPEAEIDSLVIFLRHCRTRTSRIPSGPSSAATN